MEKHIINMEDRERLTVTGVEDMDSAGEEYIKIIIENGALCIKGSGLHIAKLDLSEGKAVITGMVDSLIYTEKKKENSESFLKKLFR